MITHNVIFRWRTGTNSEEVGALQAALSLLKSQIPDINALQHGPNLNFREGGGDYAVVAKFASRSAWDAYQAHPLHLALVRDLVVPIQADRITVQFESED